MKRRRAENQPSDPERGAQQPWQAARPEAVARARQLIQDKNYPSKEVMDSVAELLVKKLKPSK